MSPHLPEHPDEVRMSFSEHLEELRKRLIHGMIGVSLAMIFTLYYGREIIKFLTEPLLRAQISAGQQPGLLAIGPATAFTVYFKTALICGIIIASPWLVYQIWKFIAVGLYAHERRVFHIISPLSAIMTILGLLFSYFVMLPIALAFLTAFASGYGDADVKGELNWFARMSQYFATTTVDEEENPQIVDIPLDPPKEPLTPEEDSLTDTPPMPDTSDIPSTQPQRVVIPFLEEDPAEPLLGEIWFNTKSMQLKVMSPNKLLYFQPARAMLVKTDMEMAYYINFVLLMTLGIVVAFQMPVILLIGGWTQVLDPRWFVKYRKYCFFGCVVGGALLTPADPLSMLVLAIPLYLLFEFGLVLAGLVYRRRDEEETP